MVNDGEFPITKAEVRIRNKNIQIYQTFLRFEAHLDFHKHYMYHWFYTTGVMVIVGMCMGTVILGGGWYGLRWRRRGENKENTFSYNAFVYDSEEE